jgi:hypothetical protein
MDRSQLHLCSTWAYCANSARKAGLRFSLWLILSKYCSSGPWPELFSLPSLFISLEMANEKEIAFLWPLASCHLYCDTYRRMRFQIRGPPEVSLRLGDLGFFYIYWRTRFWRAVLQCHKMYPKTIALIQFPTFSRDRLSFLTFGLFSKKCWTTY